MKQSINTIEQERYYEEQYRKETDPVLKEFALRGLKDYKKINLRRAKQEHKESKKHYFLGRLFFYLLILLIVCVAILVAVKHFFPALNTWDICRDALVLFLGCSCVVFFATGGLSEGGFLAVLQTFASKLPSFGENQKANPSLAAGEAPSTALPDGSIKSVPKVNFDPQESPSGTSSISLADHHQDLDKDY